MLLVFVLILLKELSSEDYNWLISSEAKSDSELSEELLELMSKSDSWDF